MKKLLALLLACMMLVSLASAAAAEAAPVSGGTLTVLGFEFATFFPAHSTTTSDRYNMAPAIEPLGRRNPDTGDTEGWLADEFVTDPEALTLTIKLHQGIKFSDGTDFNADAVLWNFQQMVDFGKASELVNPESFEKTDDYTVVLHYAAWANTWADTVGEVRIYSPAAYEANGDDWAAIHPVGTGAFVMKEMVADSHISYVKNENYWREGEPYLDGIEVLFMNDATTQLSSFINGELDVLRNPSSVGIKQLQDKYENVANNAPDLAGITYMMFCSGVEESPFSKLDVRLAVMHAIDWDEMSDAIYDGLGGSTPVFAVPGAWSYDEDLPLYEKDLDLAKKLLSDAGYPGGFNTVITINGENPMHYVSLTNPGEDNIPNLQWPGRCCQDNTVPISFYEGKHAGSFRGHFHLLAFT